MTVETITWIDPDGGTFQLSDMRGITGRGLPPSSFNDMVVPLQPGSMFRSVRDEARQVVVPIVIEGTSTIDYREQLRALAASLHPSESPGTLRVATVDGQTRDLACWYLDGFGWIEEYPTWAIPSLAFRAADPYWYDANDTQADFTPDTPAPFFPFFPLRLSSAEIFASVSIDNPGEVDVWPVWTITGPGSLVTLINHTTDKTLSLQADLEDGETVTIDTRRGQKSVVKDDGSNLFGQLVTGSVMWPLPPGPSTVDILLTDAEAESEASVRFRAGYLSV